jgi:protein gp37
VRDIRDQCAAKDVAFFFKQWGGRNKKAAGRELDARVHDGFPKIRERLQGMAG